MIFHHPCWCVSWCYCYSALVKIAWVQLHHPLALKIIYLLLHNNFSLGTLHPCRFLKYWLNKYAGALAAAAATTTTTTIPHHTTMCHHPPHHNHHHHPPPVGNFLLQQTKAVIELKLYSKRITSQISQCPPPALALPHHLFWMLPTSGFSH